MYLQQRGKLAEFFGDFRECRADDPVGAAAIARAVGGQSWEELDRDFQQWVLELSP
jgi:hypothetical protein